MGKTPEGTVQEFSTMHKLSETQTGNLLDVVKGVLSSSRDIERTMSAGR